MERLTGLDASFLYFETPTMHMHVCLAAVLDPSTMPAGYSFERVRDHIGSRVPTIAPFRRVLREVPLRLHHPVWIDDPDFDIDHHVHRVTIDAPGSLHELGRLAGDIASVPLDRGRPLWDFTIVEGLEHDRIGLIGKVHHSAMDGSAGIEILYALFDLEPNPAELADDEDDDEADPIASAIAAASPSPGSPASPASPSDLELVTQAAVDRMRSAMGVGALARRTGTAVSSIVRRRSAETGPPGGTPLDAPQTPFNGAIDAGRDMAFARISMAEVKEVKNAFGLTVNDVVLAVCARTLRRYLLDQGELPAQPLLASCPVSVRAEDESGRFGNRVSVMFARLPTDVADAVDCLRGAAAGAAGAKSEQRELGPSLLGDWAEIADPRSMSWITDQISRHRLGDRLPPVMNVVVSNIPGPAFPVYLGGARLEQAYPMGPVLEGAGLNITVLSYVDTVDIGFIAAPNLVPDVWRLADEVAPSFAELVEAALADA